MSQMYISMNHTENDRYFHNYLEIYETDMKGYFGHKFYWHIAAIWHSDKLAVLF